MRFISLSLSLSIYLSLYIYNTGWHYLSNATCPIRPRLFHACFVESRITILCHMIQSSPYAGPSAGAEIACLRKWHVWCLLAYTSRKNPAHNPHIIEKRKRT